MKFEAPRVTNYHVILGMLNSTKTLASKVLKGLPACLMNENSEMRDKSRFSNTPPLAGDVMNDIFDEIPRFLKNFIYLCVVYMGAT